MSPRTRIDFASFEHVTSAVLVALLISAVVASATGCKPQQSASTELKTLDALAGTEVGTNDCNGTNPSLSALAPDLKARAAAQITYPAAVAQQVDRAFTAVPHGLTRAILLLGYEINYRSDVAAACQGIAPGALTAATGCAKVSSVNVNGEEGEKVTLILNADPKSIAHSTLLGVMALVSNKLGRIQAEGDVLVLKDVEDAAMTGFRSDFAVAVIQDAYASGKTLPQLAGLLPVDAAFTARTTGIEQRRSLWGAFSASNPREAQAAELSIFANGGDSFYCNAKTKAALDAWPTARDLWTSEMVPDIQSLATLGLAAQTDNKVKSDEGSAEAGGMMLWGFRRPLGGFFANRVADTGYAFPRMHGLRRGWDGSGNWYDPPAWGEGRVGWRLDNNGYDNGYDAGYDNGYASDDGTGYEYE